MFRAGIGFLLILGLGFITSAQVVVSPATPPVVNQGATLKFTANVPVTWSVAPGSSGSIDADGTYHAPAIVSAKQSFGGCQLLPNDHIFNTRIDSLPVNAKSAGWIAGAGTASVNYLPSFPINYVNGSTPTQNMVFLYTPTNNGVFSIPPYPVAKIEGGWFSFATGRDRHFFTVDPNACNFQELYNYYAVGQNSDCPTCNSQSGVKYAGSSYALPANGASDAAGLYVEPLSLHLQELENAVATGGTVNHALRFTLSNGYINSSNIWPAQTFTKEGGSVPYGARFRLKSDFNISSFSPIAQVLLKQLQQYGIILADGGSNWQITTDYDKWPAAYLAAFSEIGYANIGPGNFEAVDESGLMVSSASGLTSTAERVIATSISNPSQKASSPVVLTGITLSLPKNEFYIQAGAAAQQLVAYVNGTSNTNVVWTMSPAVGTLTSGGLYTAPATLSSAMTTTITATSSANASVYAAIPMTVFPNGTIRIVNGQTTNYTDSVGNVWFAGGSCCGGDDGGFTYDNGGVWPSVPDITLYKIPFYTFDDYGDIRFDLSVPNGTYSITGKFAATNVSGAGQESMGIEVQGQIAKANVDIYAAAGGKNKPIDFTIPATVGSGQLSFVLRSVSGQGAFISALQIVPISLTPGNSGPPAPPTNVTATIQ